MCGIGGIVWNDRSARPDEALLLAMCDAMRHRGPDDAGTRSDQGIGLVSRRLAILDLSERGRMPMSTPDDRYWITFNGEIYNFQELRASLASTGEVFRTGTDTEVLLRLFAREGHAMLSRLNGMFGLAIWDTRERVLFLARDRLGVKPLYFAAQENRFLFASEPKGLFAAGVPASLDPECWEELLCFRFVAGERSVFRGIRRLLPGHLLLWKDGRFETRRWWSLAERARGLREHIPRAPEAWFRETFDHAVRLRRISDVPVGVLLSGGLDSSSVAASLAAAEGGLASFTVRFSEPGFDEGPLAREVASRYRLEHHELFLSGQDLADRLVRASWLNDEPLVHGNDVHLWAISEFAKPRVTVLLSGEGGDETLGGYVRYRPLRSWSLLRGGARAVPWILPRLRLRGRLEKLYRMLSLGRRDLAVLYNACEVLPQDLEALGVAAKGAFEFRQRVLAEAIELYPGDPVRQAMYSDQHTFLCSILDRNDRMTMGASIECRVPFLDYRLVEGLAALPSSILLAGGRGKRLLRRSVGSRLPPTVRRHRKWGFGVPWARYLREIPDLRHRLKALPDTEPLRGGPLDRGRLRATIGRFLAGDDAPAALLRQLVFLSSWSEAWVGVDRISVGAR
jgi:asparagine synthase (glutamine-hydrolysing)